MSTPNLFFDESTRILVPVILPDSEPISPWLVDFVEPLDVLLLGCYRVKEQISPEQARDEFEEDAKAAIEEIADAFSDAGTTAETKLVFTPEPVETIDRIAAENDIDVILVPAAIEQIRSVLALITPEVHLDRMRRCTSALLEDREDVELRLVEVIEPRDDNEDRDAVLGDFEQALVDTGVERDQITTRLLECEDPDEECVEVSRDYDIILMDAGEHRLRNRLLRETPCPIIIVRPQ